jgi:hypothetical protein
MGLFDKIKQAANFVTGGGANVTIAPEGSEFDKASPIKVRITAQIKDAPLNATAVYLDIRAREYVSLRKSINGKTENINEDHVSYSHKVQAVITSALEGKQSYDWELEFTLPSNAQPTFHGTMGHQVWEIKGALDVKGNDPDSGWIEIRVR